MSKATSPIDATASAHPLESLKGLRFLAEGVSNLAVLEIDQHGIIAYANPFAQRLLGSQLLGQSLDAFYIPTDRHNGKPKRDRESAAASGQLEDNHWLMRGDGNPFPACIRMAKGERDVIAVTIQQQRLQPIEMSPNDALDFFMEHAPHAIIACDATGIIIRCNPMAAALAGRMRDQVVGLYIGDPAVADQVDHARAAFDELRREGVVEGEYRLKRLDGPPIWVWLRGVRLSDNVFLGFLTDITDRKSTEKMLHAGEDRLYLALTASGIGIWNWELSANRMLLSRRCYQILGIDSFGGTLDAFRSLLYPGELARFNEGIHRLIDERVPLRLECRVQHPSGEPRWVALAAQCEFDATRRPLRLMGTMEDTSEPVRLRREADRRERRYRALIAAASFRVWSADGLGRTYRIENANQDEASPPIEIRLDQIHPDDLTGVQQAMARALTERTDFAVEMRQRQPDGSWRYQLSRAVPLIDGAGNIEEWIGITIDIDPWRSAEAKLRESKEQLQLIVDGLADHAIYLLDREGCILTWNAAAQKIDGYSREEIVGKPHSILWSEEEVSQGLPERELARAETLGSVAFEGWGVRKDGERFWAAGTVSAIRDETGKVRGFVKIARDMTKQRRAEQLVQSILDNALNGIVTVDERGTILAFNRAAATILGYEAEEMLGQNVKILLPEPYRSEHSGYIQNYLRTGVAKIIGAPREVQARRKDGTMLPVDLAVTEFFLENRRHFIGVLRDISERRKLEEQLRQSQKMEAIGLLAGGIAHDFNNLLTVIAGYGQTLQQELPSEDRKQAYVGAMIDAQEQAAALTRQLLAFSRQSVLEPKVLDLNRVVIDTERMLRRLIGEDVTLSSVLDPNVRPVKVDPAQLSQVLLNLAVNARDAMPRGGSLRLTTQHVSLPPNQTMLPLATGHYALLTVADSGQGMTSDVKARIFEPFFTTKPLGKGTGLGLSVVHGIVQASGGHIDVDSEPEKGTIFRIYFPASLEPLAETPTSAVRDAALNGTETILFVEDERTVRNLVKLVLQSHGYRVLEGIDGKDALRVLEQAQAPIDILVSDIVMPHMNGPELARELRSRIPNLKVLFTSGYTEDAVVRHGLEQDPTSFLQKPYTPTALVRKIRQVLDQAGAGQSNPSALAPKWI